MSDEQVLAMPNYRFWSMNQQIDRIRAEDNLQMLQMLAAVNSPDQYSKLIEQLSNVYGQPIKVVDVEFVQANSSAKERMKALSGANQ